MGGEGRVREWGCVGMGGGRGEREGEGRLGRVREV